MENENIIFEIMIDLEFHYINVNIFIISAFIMVFVKPLIYIKFILFFLEKTTLNFFFDVFLALQKIIHIYSIIVPCYRNVFR